MHPILRHELERNGGLVDVRGLGVPRWAVGNATRGGQLVGVHPGIYRDPAQPLDRLRAAALYVGDRGALSHTTALTVWGLASAVDDVHVTVVRDSRIRCSQAITVHTRRARDLRIMRRHALPVMPLEDTLVDAWPLQPEPNRTGCLVEAVGARMTLPERIAAALARAPHLRDRKALRVLVDKLVQGCRSHLEIFGVDRIFAGLPHFARQIRMKVGGRVYYLDAYAERERLNVELDGASWHGTAEQRERDLRRDVALATAGVRVVRFSYQRLTSEPDEVRSQLARLLGLQ
jgi:very-short-patch-repair endonuclease